MKLDKEDAEKIRKKLKAKIDTSTGAHDLAVVYVKGEPVASFGIRRGRKGLGHMHIPGDLQIRPRDAKRLATCPMKREDWIRRMVEAGLIVLQEPVN